MFRTQVIKQINFFVFHRIGKATWYGDDDDKNDNPQQAFRNSLTLELEYQIGSNFQTSLEIIRSNYESAKSGKELMDYQIYRTKTTYQMNKYLFLRSTLEYNNYEDQVLTDFLVSFTYKPGTVIHVGYGSMYEKSKWDSLERGYIKTNKFLEMDRGLFMKASYNWRL